MYKVIATLLGICVTTLVSALPQQIYFTNRTDLALNATIAGRPGKPIAAYAMSYAVPYMGVYVACQYSGKQGNCPIEFTHQTTGARVATVTLDADKAKVISAPILHGEYASQYRVSGWETSPLSHIYIDFLE
jgi:hypothetical protein